MQHTVIPTTILTVTGNYFDLAAPETTPITIEDIAHGLSNICRFTGQISNFYSVAEHCVHCSFYVEPVEHALAALMHDAAEAFVGDVSRPLKALLPEYRVIEERISRMIMAQFGIPWPMHPAIKIVDNRLLVTEQRQRMNNSDDWGLWTEGVEPIPRELACWDPPQARRRFLNRFHELKAASPT